VARVGAPGERTVTSNWVVGTKLRPCRWVQWRWRG
jgi:hypothetical protein